MRADSTTPEVDVTFEVNDNDFFAKLDDYSVVVAKGNEKLFGDEIVKEIYGKGKAGLLAYDGDLDYVNSDLAGVTVGMTVYAVTENGTSKVWATDDYSDEGPSGPLATALNNYGLRDGDEVIIEMSAEIDYIKNGAKYEPKSVVNADGTDDREQTVVTIEEETWSDRDDAGTGKYTSAKYVADDKDTLTDVIEGLPSYDDSHRVGSGKDRKTYRLVYYVNDDEVEAVWEVRADKDDKRIVWNSTPSTNDKDTNGDGKVSCDEYYGTTGLEWSDKLNACVVSSTGDAVVTIPNTATK